MVPAPAAGVGPDHSRLGARLAHGGSRIPTDSGKSTLLATMAHVAAPTSGTVATPWPIAYVPERVPARLPYTASEYLAHMGRIRGLGSSEVAHRSGELCDRLEVMPSRNIPFEDFSKGNRQKVMLAQAFLVNAATVILDEPTSGLDERATRALAELVEEACGAGSAVVSSAQRPPGWAPGGRFLRIAEGRLSETSERSTATGCTMIEAVTPVDIEIGVGVGGIVVGEIVVGGARVRAVRPDGVVVFEVAPRELDGALLELLRGGWSIHAVTPASDGGRT